LKTYNPVSLWGTIGIVALCIVSRLPQLMSPYLHADYNGDECVLGLMAQHMLRGQEFPFYFWGQNYGFSWIEAGAVALAIKSVGATVFSLKIPMLLLWTTGCVFFYAALAQWTNRIYGFLITCLLIFSPAWMDWSMKARGGYITAFLLTTIVLFLIAHHWQKPKNNTFLFIGILLGFIFFSQPIYLLGLLPLLVYFLFKQKSIQAIFICIVGFIAIYVLGKVMAHLQSNTDFWQPVWFRPNDLGLFISTFKDRVFTALNQDSGHYLASMIVSRSWCIIFMFCIGVQLFRSISKKAGVLSTLLFIGLVLTLGFTFFLDETVRYLLSLSVFLILWFGVQSFEWFDKNAFTKFSQGIVIGILIILGILTAWNYRDFYRLNPASSNEIPEIQKISKVIKFLDTSNVKYVFSIDEDLSWKLMYFSREHIISGGNLKSRQPMYSKAVAQAFLNGQKVAIVGDILHQTFAYLIVANEAKPEYLDDLYFVYLNPSKSLITDKLGFQLSELP